MKTKEKVCLLSNDVEDHSIWFNTLRYDTGKLVLDEGMPILLDIYEKFNIKSTFFFTGYMAENFPGVVKMTIDRGHEIASHGYSHTVENGFDVMPLDKQILHLKKSKSLLEDISGSQVISFRAPALRVNEHTITALLETGFKIDSSIASQRFDMFLSFGGVKKLKWLTAPRLAYKTSAKNLFERGTDGLVEVPLSAYLFPYTSTTLRIFPMFTRMQTFLVNAEAKITGKPMVFDIHPNEFIDESQNERVIKRRTKNFIKYLLADLLRGKLKVKNLGKDAIPIYENLISYYQKKNYSFLTIREYCEKNNLL